MTETRECTWYKNIDKCPHKLCEGCMWYRKLSETELEKVAKLKAKRKARGKFWDALLIYVFSVGAPIFATLFWLEIYLPENITRIPFVGACVFISLVFSSIKYKLDELENKIDKDRR